MKFILFTFSISIPPFKVFTLNRRYKKEKGFNFSKFLLKN